ncbi:MAG: hypothetical protein PF513_01410 [Tenericutes bacterium]|jgi:hypothetical protein|nr:hypothetical protein [Mycoplasmatota bacterium]
MQLKNNLYTEKKDLEEFTEIAHADPYVPSLSSVDVKKEELPDYVQKNKYLTNNQPIKLIIFFNIE